MARDSREILDDPPPPAADARLAYGPEPKQFGDLRLPGVDRLWPLAVVVHGGAWKATYNLIHAGHMCTALGKAVTEDALSKAGYSWIPALFVIVSAVTGGAVLRAGARVWPDVILGPTSVRFSTDA